MPQSPGTPEIWDAGVLGSWGALMRLIDLSFPSPQENILYDEVLLKLAEEGQGGEALRFWESSQLFVVLGRMGKIEEEVCVDQIKKDGVPVLRRFSGGGTVLQGRGCLNFSFVLSKEGKPPLDDLRKSYQIILGPVIDILKELGVRAVFKPISDLALVDGEKKFSGNAQRRVRKFILHHGTILYDFNIFLMGRYLKMPKSIPDYRGRRSHEDFVSNIPISPDRFKEALKNYFSLKEVERMLSERERQMLHDFSLEKKVVDI